MSVTPDGFGAMAHRILRLGAARAVFVLEGGYAPEVVAQCAAAVVRAHVRCLLCAPQPNGVNREWRGVSFAWDCCDERGPSGCTNDCWLFSHVALFLFAENTPNLHFCFNPSLNTLAPANSVACFNDIYASIFSAVIRFHGHFFQGLSQLFPVLSDSASSLTLTSSNSALTSKGASLHVADLLPQARPQVSEQLKAAAAPASKALSPNFDSSLKEAMDPRTPELLREVMSRT
eukprot:221659-Pleurochrysis_carterae.AAC.1